MDGNAAAPNCLAGIKVLDLTQFEAGTSCTEALAWMGAEVVKVEPPKGGEAGRRGVADPYYFMAYNANKKSITVNLKSERGLELVKDMARKADVFTENFAPGAVERLGLGYDVVSELNPRIIYAQVKGFGAGRPYEKELCFDQIANQLAKYEGVTARLRSDFGIPAAELMVQHRLVEHEIEEPKDVEKAIEAIGKNGYELSLVDRDPEAFRIKLVETETSTARNIRVPVELLASPIYAQVRTSYAKLAELIGLPPFRVKVGKETEVAQGFESLHTYVLDAAKQGLQLSRFKGLGEMNAEQLWETTMDPAKRLLIRVDVEDATAADALFSMLMGDAVEPRREFIEQNAKDVKFLDV